MREGGNPYTRPPSRPQVGFLLGDDARFVTNQNICVDAGTTTLDNLDDYEPLVPKSGPG